MADMGWSTYCGRAGPGLYLQGRVRDTVQRLRPGDQQRCARSSLANGQGREEDTLSKGDGDECLQCCRNSWSGFSFSCSPRHGQRVQPAG
eukprot:7546032-Pyramimonas_sp.AAC.1